MTTQFAQSDYRVGEVSGSLRRRQKNGAASGKLSALFASAVPTASVLFRAAPQLPRPSEQPEYPEVKVKVGKKSNGEKTPMMKTGAERKLESRERSLRSADEAERSPAARKKRGAGEAGLEKGAEHRPPKRRQRKKLDEDGKNQRTVFVGNLPVGCTKKTLLHLFQADGAVESIRFRSMVREDPAVSRKVAAIKQQAHPSAQSLNAYVVFKEPRGVTKALQRNGAEFEKDFIIRVDRVSSKSVQSHNHKRSVFVGNLNFELNESALRRHFEVCGAVEAVRLVRDRNTGLGKGFGYVLFESGDSVQLALTLEGSKLQGRTIRVKRSVEKEAESAPRRTTAAGAPGQGGRRPAHFHGEMVSPDAPKRAKRRRPRRP